MMFLFLLANLVSSGFCYETLDSESSALSSALLAKEEEESNIFFPFAYNCEWKAHIFFVHRSMHWKAVHLWTQVHQTETFFIILLSIPSSSSDVVLWRSQPFFHSKHPKKSRGERGGGDHHIYLLLLYEFQASRETERKCRESLLQREMMQSL